MTAASSLDGMSFWVSYAAKAAFSPGEAFKEYCSSPSPGTGEDVDTEARARGVRATSSLIEAVIVMDVVDLQRARGGLSVSAKHFSEVMTV